MILDGGKKSNSLFRMCNEGALYDVPIIMGTLDDARIHMGIPLTLYDVCMH